MTDPSFRKRVQAQQIEHKEFLNKQPEEIQLTYIIRPPKQRYSVSSDKKHVSGKQYQKPDKFASFLLRIHSVTFFGHITEKISPLAQNS